MGRATAIVCAAAAAASIALHAGAAELNVLCTTFPIHQITRNVVHGRDGLKVELLLPASLGCPHDYALTPQDMRKIAAADVLVVNGLGLEEFLGAPVRKANPAIVTVDTSAGIGGLLPYPDEHAGHRETEAGSPHEDGHEEHHEGMNPHLFASPRLAGRIATNIAAALSKADPAGSGVYAANAKTYAARMDALADDFKVLGQRVRNKRVVQPHGAFDYLARDAGLEIVASMQAHGVEPSAAEMLDIVRRVRACSAAAVLVEPQYSPRTGQAIARETGIPMAVLDPVATGPADAPLDYYETVMRRNLETLRATVGLRE